MLDQVYFLGSKVEGSSAKKIRIFGRSHHKSGVWPAVYNYIINIIIILIMINSTHHHE